MTYFYPPRYPRFSKHSEFSGYSYLHLKQSKKIPPSFSGEYPLKLHRGDISMHDNHSNELQCAAQTRVWPARNTSGWRLPPSAYRYAVSSSPSLGDAWACSSRDKRKRMWPSPQAWAKNIAGSHLYRPQSSCGILERPSRPVNVWVSDSFRIHITFGNSRSRCQNAAIQPNQIYIAAQNFKNVMISFFPSPTSSLPVNAYLVTRTFWSTASTWCAVELKIGLPIIGFFSSFI